MRSFKSRLRWFGNSTLFPLSKQSFAKSKYGLLSGRWFLMHNYLQNIKAVFKTSVKKLWKKKALKKLLLGILSDMLLLKHKLLVFTLFEWQEDIPYIVRITGQNTIASVNQDAVFTDIKGRMANIWTTNCDNAEHKCKYCCSLGYLNYWQAKIILVSSQYGKDSWLLPC